MQAAFFPVHIQYCFKDQYNLHPYFLGGGEGGGVNGLVCIGYGLDLENIAIIYIERKYLSQFLITKIRSYESNSYTILTNFLVFYYVIRLFSKFKSN